MTNVVGTKNMIRMQEKKKFRFDNQVVWRANVHEFDEDVWNRDR